MGGTGLEPVAITPNDTESSGNAVGGGGAKSGALSGDSCPGGALPALADPELMAVVAAWPTLPEAVRQRIAGAVKAAADGG